MNNWMEIATLATLLVLIAVAVLQWRILSRQSGDNQSEQFRNELEKIERNLREQIQASAQSTRQELGGNFAQFQQSLAAQLTSVATLQNSQIDGFSQQLVKLNENNAQQLEQMRTALTQQAQTARDEQSLSLKRFADTLNQTLASLSESNAQRLNEIRQTLEQKIGQLQADNAGKLEEMRKTVDEKLHATLEQRLGESFKHVSDRLEKVHQGLGEMQQLAIGVGDLKRVLTNVKTRGTWGEVQLEMVLEQMLTPDQYAKNVETVPNSGERVEFAIKLPGKEDERAPVWMPIDAKFPKEQSER